MPFTPRKPPTLSESRKAFRDTMEAIGLDVDQRPTAYQLFNEYLGIKQVKRRTRRQEQNQGIRDAQELSEIMPELLQKSVKAMLRNDFTSGERLHETNELADMTGTPAPHYGDPTGESACWEERADRTGLNISRMAEALGEWLTIARLLKDQSNTDVRERAKKSMPDCLACGNPVLDKVISGYDRKCYNKWVRLGRPDRHKFHLEQKALGELADEDLNKSDINSDD